MLAKPTRGIADILSRFDGKRLTCEYKYDGLRGQVHYFDGNIQIFSNILLNNVKFVEVSESMSNEAKIRKNHAKK